MECLINDCGRTSRKRGMCDSHYSTARRSGSIIITKKELCLSDWMPDKELLSWAAGFFDGEGSFYLVKSATSKCGFIPFASVSQSGNIEVLEKFNCAVGHMANISKPRLIEGHQPAYKLDFSGYQKTQQIACMLWPWLGSVKKQKAKYVLESCR